MSSVLLRDLSKHYGHFRAIDGVNLTIPKGQFITLLGPSGCGKTTLLRSVAGFVSPTAGDILFDDRVVTSVDANRRNTGMVFQNFALFPHLTVAENVAFGLRVRKVKASEIDQRVKEALELVSLQDFAARLPQQLSGGQQQRVALARAVVIRPDVLLLDEPLSALDAKLRLELQTHIRDVQQTLGVTAIYVTHDQSEALRMSDQIAVMNAGKIEQLAAPTTLYRRPHSAFVAKFIGQANLLSVKMVSIAADGRSCKVHWPSANIELTVHLDEGNAIGVGETCLLGIRPEAFSLGQSQPNAIKGKVAKVGYSGSVWNVKLAIDTGTVIDTELTYMDQPPRAGENATVSWHPQDCFILASA